MDASPAPRVDAPPPTIEGVADLVVIGRGGFGTVYRGRQAHLDRDVAVKVLDAHDADGRALERFRREVGAMGRLSNHPNIVAVYDGGTTADGRPFLVMPYVPGGSLGELVRRDGPLGAERVATMGAKLAGALASTHAAGVLHRDVKPDNVLLSPYGEPQLTDFGIARLADATITAWQSVALTVHYAAPEILGGEPASETSDVYALGATLHTCLTGSPPFQGDPGEPLMTVVGRIATQPAPDLRALGVDDPLAEVIEAAMVKDPGARIATANGLRLRLDAAATSLAPAPPLPTERTDLHPRTHSPTTVAAAPPVASPPSPGDPELTGVVPAPLAPRPPAPAVANQARADAAIEAPPAPKPGPVAADPGPVDEVEAPPATKPAPAEPPVPDTPPVLAPPPPRLRPSTTRPAAPRDRRGRWETRAAGAVAALVAVAGLALLVVTLGGDDADDAGAGPETTVDAGDGGAAPAEPDDDTEAAPGGRAVASDDLTATATGYLGALAAGDLDGAFAMLSPGLADSQPRSDWEAFWTGFDQIAVVGEPRVDQAGAAVTVPISLDGSTEEYRLTFVSADDGTWLVDGPRPG